MSLPPGFKPENWPPSPKGPVRPTVPPHVRKIGFIVPWRGLRYAGYVFVCILAAVLCFAAGRGCEGLPEPPAPSPAPISGQVWLSLIYDINMPGQDFGQISTDVALKDGLAAMGVKKRQFPKGDLDAKKLGIDDLATSTPWMVINAVGTEKIDSEPLPKTTEEVLAAVKKFKRAKR